MEEPWMVCWGVEGLGVVVVEVPYILLGDPGPETRGPNTPGREKY